MQEGESELEEVERELSDSKRSKSGSRLDAKGKAAPNAFVQMLRRFLPVVMVETFVLTFLAEWGDRSQIATIGAPRDRCVPLQTAWLELGTYKLDNQGFSGFWGAVTSHLVCKIVGKNPLC